MTSAFIKSKARLPSHLIAPGALSLGLISGFAVGQEVAAGAAHQLGTMKVEEQAVQPSFKADTTSSPKFTQPLVDTPQTLVVVKKELFEQQAATTLSEALRNTPGITLLMGENGNTATGDSIFMRGFDAQGSVYVDGIRDLGSISRDTFNTEQVEIAKGPAGVDNGRGAAAGYVNLSSKLANLDEDINRVTVHGGTAQYARASLDANRALGERTALRVNLMQQDAGVDGRDEVESNYRGFAASLGLGLGSATRTYLNVLSMEQSGVPDGGVPTIGLNGYYNAIFDTGALAGQRPKQVDASNFYGSSADFNDVHANMVTVRVEQDMAPGITLRNTSRYGRNEQNMLLTGVNAITFTTPSDPSSWVVARSRQGRDQTNQIFANQSNLVAAFDTGGLAHDLVGGLEFIHEEQLSKTLGLPFTAPSASSTVSQVSANLYQPNGQDPFQPVHYTGAKTYGETTTYALYLQDTLSLNKQWELSAGLRADRFHTRTDAVTRQAAVTAPAVQLIPIGTLLASGAELTDELLGWKLGAVYKPSQAGSVYLSYATSQLPPGGANFALNTSNDSGNINHPSMAPQEGTNLELGTKWNVLDDKMFLTAALFRSTNTNEIATEADGVAKAVGERQVQGLELGAVGALTEQWQVSAGLAFMDPEIIRGNRTQDNPTTTANEASGNNEGGAIQWSPKTTFTLWTSYTLTPQWVVGAGARYVDSMVSSSVVNPSARNTRSMREFGDYWVFDAMASYAITDALTAQLNLTNLTDEDYVASLNNAGSRYYPGAPAAGRLGLTWQF